MTCEDFQNYLDHEPSVETEEVAEHIVACPGCNRLVAGQRELTKLLHLVRDSAPPIPGSLDKAVISKYQSFVSEHSCLVKAAPAEQRIGSRGALGWAAALAFAVVVAYGGIVLLSPRQHVWVDQQAAAGQPLVPSGQSKVNKETTPPPKIARKAPKRHADPVKRANDPASVAQDDNSFPQFQSLMYCDQISCPGAMEVVRVQLPPPVLGLMPASARVNGAISADVLVGPDGIARGIRVIE
jgi:hypothetical protein